MVGILDGLGGEEVGQEVTITEIISGTNIYATTKVSSALLTGANVSGTTAVRGVAIIGTNISGTNIRIDSEGLLHSTSIGSPTSVYGAKIQAGSAILAAGSNLWLKFPTVFTGNPVITVTDMTTANTALYIAVGSINAGSCYIEGPTASDAFSWIAIGI